MFLSLNGSSRYGGNCIGRQAIEGDLVIFVSTPVTVPLDVGYHRWVKLRPSESRLLLCIVVVLSWINLSLTRDIMYPLRVRVQLSGRVVIVSIISEVVRVLYFINIAVL